MKNYDLRWDKLIREDLKWHICSRMIPFSMLLIQILYGHHLVSGQTTTAIREQINKIIEKDTDIDFERIPGFIVVAIDHDNVYIDSFGSISDADGICENTDQLIFQLGGTSKIFTALIAEIMMERKMLDRDHSMLQYLDLKEPHHNLTRITINHLLTHTSGLPNIPDDLAGHSKNEQGRYQYYSKQNLLDHLQSSTMLQSPGHYQYSHYNYALLEIILENVSGHTFPELLHDYITDPFQLKGTGVGAPPITCRTIGHNRAGKIVAPWSFSSFSGSEGIYSCPQDLAVFMKRILNEDHPYEHIFERTLKPFVKIEGYKRAYTASGWHLFRHKRHEPVYLHSGKTDGHATSIHFLKQTKTAVILLTNAPGSMDGLAMLILRMLNRQWKRKQ